MMHFDASPKLATLVREKLRHDTRLIRLRLVRRPKYEQYGLTVPPSETETH